jgi:hypothetical protein
LFAAAISSSHDCTVLTGAAATDVGAVAVVALIVPGFVLGRVLVLTH